MGRSPVLLYGRSRNLAAALMRLAPMLDKLLRLAAATLLLSSGTESLLAQVGEGSLELASPFVEGAILQREMPVPIWGWASPGSAIRVSFACLLYTSPSPRDATLSRMPSSA